MSETNRDAVERGLFKGLEFFRRLGGPLSESEAITMVQPMVCPYAPDAQPGDLHCVAIGLLAAFKLCAWKLGQWRAGGVATAMVLRHRLLRRRGRTPQVLESTSGYYLDITCDNIVHVAVFVGIAWSGYQELGQTHVLLLGGLAAFGTLMGFIVVGHTTWPCTASFGILDRLIDALANRDFSLILVICALTGTLQWFLWALAIGVNLFWLIALGLARQAQRTAHG